MEEWKKYKLGDISNMKYGKLPPKKDNGSYPIWSGYKYSGFATTFNCRKGTVVVIARGVGGTGDVKISREDCYLTNLSISIDLDKTICHPLYFYYKYKTHNLRYLDTGSAQSQITIDDLKRMELKLPTLEQQTQIIKILSSLDSKIELNRRINDNLEQQAQALFKAWFVDFEPFKDGKFVESELGMIPEGWKVLKFNSFITPLNEKVQTGILPEYSVTNNGIIPRSEKFSKQLSSSTSKNKVLKFNNIVFGMSREILNWGIMQDKIGSVSSAYHVYNINEDIISPLYLKYLMETMSSYFNDLIGATSREGQSLDKNALMKKLVYIPSPEIWDSFVNINTSLRNKQNENLNEISLLLNLRDTLLPKLMSGELKINDLNC